jgi:hypothetical protein
MSDQGKAYSAFVENELKAERERRAAFDLRGQGLVTTSSALVTLLAGTSALVKTGTAVTIPSTVLILVCAALTLFAIAAACGIVASWNRAYTVAKVSTLQSMLKDRWGDDEVDARNNVGAVQLKTVHTLRVVNKFKARCISTGHIAQVAALVVLATAVVLVIARS